ncbi:hypothetical protein BDR05DRAFT_921487 [Suillus weaverae]|nr:hypothetical protein BDR05DRAFT_921487 [Suillus weaverae]
MSFARLALRSVTRARPVLAASSRQTWAFRANYSAPAGLSKETIQTRVLDVLKGFEKVDAVKLATSSSFTDDLGLDSLDTVEVVMAVEEVRGHIYIRRELHQHVLQQEFAIEIPDAEADEIKTVQQAIDYIAKTPEGQDIICLRNVSTDLLCSSLRDW